MTVGSISYLMQRLRSSMHPAHPAELQFMNVMKKPAGKFSYLCGRKSQKPRKGILASSLSTHCACARVIQMKHWTLRPKMKKKATSEALRGNIAAQKICTSKCQ